MEQNVGEEEDGRRGYYVLPCFVLLSRSDRIVNHVLKVMRTWTCEKARIIAVVGVLLLMHDEDVRRGGGSGQIFKKIAATRNSKEEIDAILHNIIRVMVIKHFQLFSFCFYFFKPDDPD